jgi:hypothetical protein
MTRSTLKASFFTRLILGSLVVTGSVTAQMIPPQDGDLAAHVPFSFTVGESTLPAGEYLLRVNPDGSILICEDGVYCNAVRDLTVRRAAAAPSLVFVQTEHETRFAGLGEPADAPCAELKTVQSRKLSIDRFEGALFAMAWR